MRVRAVVAAVMMGSALVTTSARAQRKDPGVATVLSLVIPGGGQFYSEASQRGLLFFLGSVGAISAGVIAGKDPIAPIDTPFGIIPGDPNHYNSGPVIAGLIVGGTVWLWGVADAAPIARRFNAAHNLAFAPIADQRGIGLRVTFGAHRLQSR